MTAFSRRVAELTHVAEDRLVPLAGESLSEVLLVPWPDGRRTVAKSGPASSYEATMLRALAASGVPAPRVEAEYEGVLLLEYVENDGRFTERAWADIGARLRALHQRTGGDRRRYGWPADYALGSVIMPNRESDDWRLFWAEQRLVATAGVLDRVWRLRVDALAARLEGLLPRSPPAALLHGDLWTGNMLVRKGRLVGLVDPACYYGDAEVDLAMLELFCVVPPAFHEAYGPLDPGWEGRRPVYQLFPALVHVRLWGPGYYPMLDRLLSAAGA